MREEAPSVLKVAAGVAQVVPLLRHFGARVGQRAKEGPRLIWQHRPIVSAVNDEERRWGKPIGNADARVQSSLNARIALLPSISVTALGFIRSHRVVRQLG